MVAHSFPEFSVSMAVYKGDNPQDFRCALESVVNQSVQPKEIILVVDGPIPNDLNTLIENARSKYSLLKVIKLPKNKGHAIARQVGIDRTCSEYIALMDADDLSVPDRFERQLERFKENPDLDIVGGQINEFINTVDNIVGARIVPLTDTGIKTYLKRRCPFNQMTVMMKKSAMLEAGGYIDWYCEEDYYLWIRMFENNSKFANLNQSLVYVRVGNDMYQRRGGLRYFISEFKIQRYLLKKGIIKYPLFYYNVIIRFGIQVIIPNYLRGVIFRRIARSKKLE